MLKFHMLPCILLSALTAAGNAFITGGREEVGSIWAEATLQLHFCHFRELTDREDEFIVVPADTTAYYVKATP